MPDISTQTGEFIVLHADDVKKLPVAERKEYKIELKKYKKQVAKEKYNEYMRTYMKTYSKMKYKYDKQYKQYHKDMSKYYYALKKENERGIKPLSSLLDNMTILE